MKLLLINNDSDSWQALLSVVSSCGYDITAIPHTDIRSYDVSQFDGAILSGGWWYTDPIELLQAYGEELRFIRTSPIPILGICIGMQLMHVALDQAVPLMDEPQSGYRTIQVTAHGQSILGFPSEIQVYKNHTRAIVEADPLFEVLATSPGHVEIMKHRSRPLLGVQFHPEKGEQAIATTQRLLEVIMAPSV